MKKFTLFLIPLFALVLLIGCSPAQPTTPPVSKARAPIGFTGTLLAGKQTVVMSTAKGDITLELDADSAPRTVTNFVLLSQSGYYNGLTFHRVIPDFMIQGGDPDGTGMGGTSVFGPTFADEFQGNALPMDRGMIAMANRGPNTNGSQFFIITRNGGTPWLAGKHTVFGKVISGMDVVDAIASVPRGPTDTPTVPVTFDVEVKK